MTQAVTIWRATDQRTADSRRAAPTPMIAPVMVWVVETGMPRPVAINNVIEPAVSAQTPCTGVSRVTSRRYLDRLARSGLVAVTMRYGKAGRPEHRYRWADAVAAGGP